MRLLQLKHALEKATSHVGVRLVSDLFVCGNACVRLIGRKHDIGERCGCDLGYCMPQPLQKDEPVRLYIRNLACD